MKRFVLISLTCLIVACAGGTIAALMLIESNANPGDLPVYPGAQNVQRAEPALYTLPYVRVSTPWTGSGFQYRMSGGPTGPTLYFTTTASAQSLYDFYDNWLTSQGWSSTAQSSRTEGAFQKPGSWDLSRISFNGFSGLFVPRFVVPRHHFDASVTVGSANSVTYVRIYVSDSVY